MIIKEAEKLFKEAINLIEKKNFVKSKIIFFDLLKFFPERFSILLNLSKIYFFERNYSEAIKTLKKIKNSDHNEYTYFLIGLCYSSEKKFKEAIFFFHKSLKIKKKIEINFELIKIYDQLDKSNLSKKYLQNVYNLTNNEYYKFLQIFKFDFVYQTKEHYEKNRALLIKGLKFYENSNFDFSIEKKVSSPTFIHAYNNLDNKELYFLIRKVLKKVYKLNSNNINIENLKTNQTLHYDKNKRIKIGFVSQFLTSHTIGKLFYGIITRLDRSKFEVYIFHSSYTLDSLMKQQIDLCDVTSVTLPNDLNSKIEVVSKYNLDVLFYTDIGMSSDLFYLTFYRLAKKQMTSWGHPDTTSEPNIDYFLSSKFLESNEKILNKNYSEKVILLESLPMFYAKPKVIKKKKPIKNLIACPQALFKIHPDFDKFLLRIFEMNNSVKIVFIKDSDKIIYLKLKKRFQRTLGAYFRNVFFINPQSKENFVHLCGLSSVLLDPIYFGAGNTFHESMVYGTPTITMPTDHIRSRIVIGAYKQMKVDYKRFVANNMDDYALKTIQYSQNYHLNLKVREELSRSADNFLYENVNTVNNFEGEINKLINS